MNILRDIFNWLLNLTFSFVEVMNWLVTPLWEGMTPLFIITGSGLIAILAVWLIKFISPLS